MRAVTSFRMGRPTLRTSEFAAWLQGQRNDRSLEEVARLVRRAVAGVIAFDRSSWKKLEEGQLPNVIQLYGISRALDVPLDALVRRILQDLDVPVDAPASLRNAPPVSAEGQTIGRNYDKADAPRRSAVRLLLAGARDQAARSVREERSGDQRARAGRRKGS